MKLGNAWFPVTGGLFLGDDASAAETQLTGHFPDSQDQRNTVRGRLRYQVNRAFGSRAEFNMTRGLPFDFDGDPATRARASTASRFWTASTSHGAASILRFRSTPRRARTFTSRTHVNVNFQVDGQNLTNVLNVIDFGGLFSGNAIGPSRSFALRLTSTF